MAKKKTTKKKVAKKKPAASTLSAELEKTIEKDFQACEELLVTGASRNEWVETNCEHVAAWQEAAEAGDARGQLLYGLCYYFAHGREEDGDQASEWFRKSAEQGNTQGQFSLGQCYFFGQFYSDAVEWYRKSAERGNVLAQLHLGFCYQFGWGAEVDDERAVKWFQKAAEQGSWEGQINLGQCYRNGRGVKADETKAVDLYQEAAIKVMPIGDCGQIAFTHDGQFIVTGGPKMNVCLWETVTGNLAAQLTVGCSGIQVTGIAISKDRTRLLSTGWAGNCDHSEVFIWDLENRTLLLRFEHWCAEYEGYEGLWSPDNRYVAFYDPTKNDHGTLWIYDAETGNPAGNEDGMSCEFENYPIKFAAFSHDAESLVVGYRKVMRRASKKDACIKRLPFTEGDVSKPAETIKFPAGDYYQGTFAFEGQTNTVFFQQAQDSIKRWNVLTGEELAPISAFSPVGEQQINRLVTSDDGQLLGASLSSMPAGLVRRGECNRVIVFSLKENTVLFDKDTPPIQDIGFSPDGRLLAGWNPDHGLFVWDISTGSKLVGTI